MLDALALTEAKKRYLLRAGSQPGHPGYLLRAGSAKCSLGIYSALRSQVNETWGSGSGRGSFLRRRFLIFVFPTWSGSGFPKFRQR